MSAATLNERVQHEHAHNRLPSPIPHLVYDVTNIERTLQCMIGKDHVL